ncbi:MAG: hypothetical protein ABIJ56_10055 [Pseudomonadota bacterium]
MAILSSLAYSETDACSGGGECIGAGNVCEDDVSCTLDTCSEDRDECDDEIETGWCFLDGECLEDEGPDPENPCRKCDTYISATDWTNLDDMAECSDAGVCCGHVCRLGGHCCDTADCTGCSGTAAPCEDFTNMFDCMSQDGCSWSGANCLGVPDPCTIYTISMFCTLQAGCHWGSVTCIDYLCVSSG